MAKRYYFVQLVNGIGRFRAGGIAHAVNLPVENVQYVGNFVPTTIGAWAFIEVEVTTQQHNTIRADVRFLYLPFEESGTGRVLELDENTNLMAQLDIDRVISRCEQVGVPLHDFAGKTKRQVVRRIHKRLSLRQQLGVNDFVEGLDTTFGSMSAGRRATVRDSLQLLGADTTVINGPDTIRIVIQKILDQDLPSLKVRI
jgi:hypothetical protein